MDYAHPNLLCYTLNNNWLVVSILVKWDSSSQLNGKIKVMFPNHQPVVISSATGVFDAQNVPRDFEKTTASM